MAGSGTCAGWWPASGWRAGRTARPRRASRRRSGRASAPTGRSCVASPTSRCSPAPSPDSTSTGSPGQTAGPLQDEVIRSANRARNRTSDRALPRFTQEVDGVRKIVEEPPLITRLPDAGSAGAGRGARRLPGDPVHPLAARPRRLHPARRRAQGGGRRQRRPARVCGAAGRVFAGGRRLSPAEAGAAVGAGALRARRVGVARASGPARRRVPAGAADRERPAARAGPRWTAGSTTCGSSAT